MKIIKWYIGIMTKAFGFGGNLGNKTALLIMNNIEKVGLYGNIIFDSVGLIFISFLVFQIKPPFFILLIFIHIFIAILNILIQRIKSIKDFNL